MQTFRLADDFTDAATEQSLIASIVQTPALYWELGAALPVDAFAVESAAWAALAAAVIAEQRPECPASWCPSSDPAGAAHRLSDLAQRRMLARAQERLAAALYDQSRPAGEIAVLLEEEAIRAQATVRDDQGDQLQWAVDLISGVLRTAEERKEHHDRTGKAFSGLPTGIDALNLQLNGLNEGLILAGGAPGIGKTTFMFGVARAVAREGVPVVYVTYENSPTNLTLKAIASLAGLDTRKIERGVADLSKLRKAAQEWAPIGQYIAIVEGTSRLTLAQLRAKALQAMNRHKSDRCLIVVDYLQLAAKGSAELRSLGTVQERIEVMAAGLREMAMRLHSPVIAISSQNRASGDYGGGDGAAALDSLKGSGDLEYSADQVFFLTRSKKRLATLPAVAIDLTIAKDRNGDTGCIELIFRKDTGTFAEVAKS